MDSSGLQGASSPSISSNHGCEKEASAMIRSRRAEFFANYKRQNFSLPNSIMFYITKNPTTAKVYEKMIQSCKDFYVKNPVLVVPAFSYLCDGEWYLPLKPRRIDLSKITSKIWITDEFFVERGTVSENILSSLMPKLYRCDAKLVSIQYKSISFHDLSLLISSAERIELDNVTVKDGSGSDVAFEKVVEIAVKAKEIEIQSDTIHSSITSNTMKELIKLPHFSKLDGFTLYDIPETFDLETFYGYLKKNKTTKLWFCFDDSVSETYKNRLEEIVDEILATENRDYLIPLIDFADIDVQKWRKLARIFSSYFRSVGIWFSKE